MLIGITPQESFLSPQLISTYINDLEEGAVCKVIKFADDTGISGRACFAEDISILRQDTDKLSVWVRTWKIKFEMGKCEVMYYG